MEIIQQIISPEGYFPGNPYYPLVIYKQAFETSNLSSQFVEALLKKNHWIHSWVDSIYGYHHYHSNTHEVLVIISGNCQAQFGGNKGVIYTLSEGDVVILPAGVAHKSLSMSNNFRCMGAYPFDIDYDMKYGKTEEYSQAVEAIKEVALPKKDPIFGEKGALFNYWK